MKRVFVGNLALANFATMSGRGFFGLEIQALGERNVVEILKMNGAVLFGDEKMASLLGRATECSASFSSAPAALNLESNQNTVLWVLEYSGPAVAEDADYLPEGGKFKPYLITVRPW